MLVGVMLADVVALVGTADVVLGSVDMYSVFSAVIQFSVHSTVLVYSVQLYSTVLVYSPVYSECVRGRSDVMLLYCTLNTDYTVH